MEIELPEDVNSKKVNKVLSVTLEKIEEAVTENEVVNETENTNTETQEQASEDTVTESEENASGENTTETTEEATSENNVTTEEEPGEENVTEQNDSESTESEENVETQEQIAQENEETVIEIKDNKITISFVNNADLNRILSVLNIKGDKVKDINLNAPNIVYIGENL